MLITDICLGFDIRTGSRGTQNIKIEKIYWPGYTPRDNFLSIYEHAYNCDTPDELVLFLSDIHFGSHQFYAEEFTKMVKYSNSLKKLKHIIIAGDVIEGCGVFPGQEKYVVGGTLEAQYAVMQKYLAMFREDIKIYISCGNHDPARSLAEPQIFLPDFKKWCPPNTVLLPNPATIEIGGRRILIYHGASLNTLIDLVEDFTYDRPVEVMKYMLKVAHVAPVHGHKYTVLPTEQDIHVITQRPDIFVTGHIHHNGLQTHGAVTVLNPGTWQPKTGYQTIVGAIPTPGIVPYESLLNPSKFFTKKFVEVEDQDSKKGPNAKIDAAEGAKIAEGH